MNNVKIGICGHFGGNKDFFDGQTVKTKEISNLIEERYNKKINKFDTYKNSHNPFKLIYGINKLLKNNDIFILIVSTRGYNIILPLINIFNFFYKRKLYDFVIGGTRYQVYDKKKFIKKIAMKFNKIYVETQGMKDEYNKRGFNNVEVLPNFKKIKIYEDVEKYQEKEKIKLCTFTRIRKEKGIEDAIEAVKLANKKIGKDIFVLDIYGKPDNDYAENFEKIVKELPDFINYKGLVPSSESSSKIHNYDLMLFLTYWSNEGFPGTIIDAFCSGTPVIATDWNCNFEVLKENFTGFKVSVKGINEVCDKLIYCYKNQKKIYKMRSNCIMEAKRYLPNNVMKIFFDEIEEVN